VNYAKAIKHGMRLKGYRTQLELSEALGVAGGMISMLTLGKVKNPRYATLSKLACAFDVQVSEFIKWGEE